MQTLHNVYMCMMKQINVDLVSIHLKVYIYTIRKFEEKDGLMHPLSRRKKNLARLKSENFFLFFILFNSINPLLGEVYPHWTITGFLSFFISCILIIQIKVQSFVENVLMYVCMSHHQGKTAKPICPKFCTQIHLGPEIKKKF